MFLIDTIKNITSNINYYMLSMMCVIFVLSFGESLFFISLLLPATVIILGLSAFIKNNGVAFLPIWLAASLGAFLGDWLSYWLGHHYKNNISRIWLINRHPLWLKKGYIFFKKYGILGVFFSRFFGPLRAIIPLIAGICNMPIYRFQLANLLSSMMWALIILTPGTISSHWLSKIF
uniref:DedA family protein n=1 Tax=Candidatus Aschnera chinzeii TaxID=1485666 RepID=A0AAT9G515_9ENTR|nr:MAG: DedA family protein [Candidatus Aschnera chinzeii]